MKLGFLSRTFTGKVLNRALDIVNPVCAGPLLTVKVDGSIVLSASLPSGAWQVEVDLSSPEESDGRGTTRNLASGSRSAFVAMQFSERNNELYTEVIRKVCKEFGLEATRSDEICGPGEIPADIRRDIRDSDVVIAEITDNNLNVFYEIGHAHAFDKPTILIAQKDRNLPFDISAYRVLFYEDTIAGKARIEQDLRKYIRAILGQAVAAQRTSLYGR